MSSRWKCKTAFWAVGAFVFGLVCVRRYSFADFVLGSLEDRRQHCVMCFLFVCWLCFGKHGSREDTQTFRAARRFPVVRLACTLAEEFFCWTTSVSRHTECPKNQGAPSGCVVPLLCLTERVLLRGTSVRGLASLDERNIGHRFLFRPTEQISAEWERVYVDLSLSCMAPEGRAAMTPYVVGNPRKHFSLALWWLCFQCVLIGFWCQVWFCFVSVFVSSLLWCDPQVYAQINGCGLKRVSSLFVNSGFAIGGDGQGTPNAVAHSVHVVSDVCRCRAVTCGLIPYVC